MVFYGRERGQGAREVWLAKLLAGKRFQVRSFLMIDSQRVSGKGFLHVSAHSVSLKRNNIPQLLIFSRYFSYKWMILQNANSFLSGSTASVSEWKPNYLYFLQGT